MWNWGLKFVVHPSAYVIHVHHPPSQAKELTEKLKQGSKACAKSCLVYMRHSCFCLSELAVFNTSG